MAEKKQSINFEMILRSAIELPGIKISRTDYLRKSLSKHFGEDIVNKAIETNPAQAGISVKDLDRISKSSINYETSRVTGLSAAAGIPGGWAMAATIPADAAQFFGHIIRMLQKLAYLYGWQEMFKDDGDDFDDETANKLIIFIGVMFGVKVANATLMKIAGLAALNVPKLLMRQALTKGAIYPIVKKIAAVIGAKMTTAIFAKGVGKIIPVVGAVVSGGITFAFFKPMSIRLKKYLASLPPADVEFYESSHDDDVIEVDFTDIDIENSEVIDDNEE